MVKVRCYSKSILPKFTIHNSPFIIFRICSHLSSEKLHRLRSPRQKVQITLAPNDGAISLNAKL